MPQIGQLTADSWYLVSQLFWICLVFAAIFFVVGRGMLPKVEATVDARDRQIAGDLAAAKRARDGADQIEADWRTRSNAARAEAAAVVADAKAKGAADTAARVAVADAAIEQQMASAEREIAAARTSALAEIEGVAVEAAQDIVVRLTGAVPAANSIADAVKARIHA